MNTDTLIAIKGSKSNPQQVIKRLKDLGGINFYNHKGNDDSAYYYIDHENRISCKIFPPVELKLINI